MQTWKTRFSSYAHSLEVVRLTDDVKVVLAKLQAEDRRLEQMIVEDRITSKEIIATLFRKIDGLCDELKKMGERHQKELIAIRQDQADKPSWSVAIVITVLCSIVAGLGVAFLKGGM
ncbi:MAG: hypothetical protein QMD11_05540 [Smithella sp.]|nr:hypothetical protein [Smithella sp.]